MDGFLAGTRIDTPLGERKVEDLRPGDAVLTPEGRVARVAWTGGGMIEPGDDTHAPVSVRAGALADDLPRRNLLAAPDQAIGLADDAGPVLLPLRRIINMTSISRMDSSPVTYLRIALDGGACLMAEGVPARPAPLPPDLAAGEPDRRAAVTTPGPALARVSHAIDRRAGPSAPPLRGGIDPNIRATLQGWVLDRADPDRPVDLELLCDGALIARAVADRPRPDVLRTFGYLACGFVFPLPQPPRGGLQQIELRRAGDGLEFVAQAILHDDKRLDAPAADDAGKRGALIAELVALIDRLRAHPTA